MLHQLMAFRLDDGRHLGDIDVGALVEGDVEQFFRDLAVKNRARSTVNHYVQITKRLNRWIVEKRRRGLPFLTGTSVIIRRKEKPRNRRLLASEEERLLKVASPPLHDVIVAALDTACRKSGILTLQVSEVRLNRNEIALPAEKTKDGEPREIPIFHRLTTICSRGRRRSTGSSAQDTTTSSVTTSATG